MVGSSSDPDIHLCFLLLVAAAGTLVADGILAEDVVPTLGHVMPLHHKRSSHGSSMLGCSA